MLTQETALQTRIVSPLHDFIYKLIREEQAGNIAVFPSAMSLVLSLVLFLSLATATYSQILRSNMLAMLSEPVTFFGIPKAVCLFPPATCPLSPVPLSPVPCPLSPVPCPLSPVSCPLPHVPCT